MIRFISFVLASSIFSNAIASPCLVSNPNFSNPEGAIRPSSGLGWFGSEELAAIIPINGNWLGMGVEHAYRNKFWWWYKGAETESSSKPSLKIVARNIRTGQEFSVNEPSSASTGSDNYQWYSLVTILEFPANGCWQIVGAQEHRKLTIVLKVGE